MDELKNGNNRPYGRYCNEFSYRFNRRGMQLQISFFYFHRTCMIVYWRGRKDSDLRDVREHVSPD